MPISRQHLCQTGSCRNPCRGRSCRAAPRAVGLQIDALCHRLRPRDAAAEHADLGADLLAANSNPAIAPGACTGITAAGDSRSLTLTDATTATSVCGWPASADGPAGRAKSRKTGGNAFATSGRHALHVASGAQENLNRSGLVPTSE
jgi:hypothetical protein